MTPDYALIAKRVNARLAEQAKPGTMPEVFSAIRIGRVLAGGTGHCGSIHAPLIREIAAEVAGEGAK
jgi:hypothetical protein